MKRKYLLAISLIAVLCLSACDKADHVPTSPEQPTASVNQQPCADTHSFTEDSDLCAVCGADYYAETLELELGGTKKYYIVTGIGTCNRTDIKIPTTYNGKPVTEIGQRAFAECASLESIYISGDVSVISEYAFANCSSLKTVTLPEGLKEIGQYAFQNCGALSQLELPENLRNLSDGMIDNCVSLENIRIPAEATVIPKFFARNCSSLKNVEVLGEITIVREGAFMQCTGLTELQLPDTVVRIERDAFTNCTGLYQVYEGMNYVGNDANPYLVFLGKSDPERTDVLVHNDAKIIAEYALYDNEVTSLILGEKTVVIGGISYIKGVKTVDVAPGNTRFHCAGNCIIETETKTLIRGCADSVIPNDGSVTVIEVGAFAGLDDVKLIVIPDTVTEIGSNAFMNCENLEALVIGSGVRKIGNGILAGSSKFAATYYNGTKEAWNKISIVAWSSSSGMTLGGNKEFRNGTLYYYSETQPTDEGNYWRYVDGVPTPWETAE